MCSTSARPSCSTTGTGISSTRACPCAPVATTPALAAAVRNSRSVAPPIYKPQTRKPSTSARLFRDRHIFQQPLLLDEGPLDQVVPRVTHARRCLQAEAVEYRAGVGQHARAAADHRAVVFRVDRRQVDVAEQLAAAHQVGQTALILERLTGNGGVIDQLFLQRLTEVFVLRQQLGDE